MKTKVLETPQSTSRKSPNPELAQWEAFSRICNSPEYQDFLKPLLVAAQANLWLNPEELDKDNRPVFPSLKAFHKAYTEMLGRARAYKEIQTMIDNAATYLKSVREQKETKKTYEF